MFRKHAVLDIGGYDETREQVEDYDLWLRLLLLEKKTASMVSLPRVGLWYRKHGTRNVDQSTRQADEATLVVTRAIQRIIEERVDASIVKLMRKPSTGASVSDINGAAALVTKLESCFLHKYKAELTDRETKLIQLDCNERIGEFAVLVFTLDKKVGLNEAQSSLAWRLWSERCPDRALERLALLCQQC
jgi:hypothetical protein